MLKKYGYQDSLDQVDIELETNIEINNMYSQDNILNGTEVTISYIKVTKRRYKIIVFEPIITDQDWYSLIYYLKLKDNKIIGLDFRDSGFDKYFDKFLKHMKEPNLYYNFRYLKLGV